MKYPYLKLYWLFGILALTSALAVGFCLLQISPWAVWAVIAAMLFKLFAWLQEEAWHEYRTYKALTAPFAASSPSKEGE